MTDLKTKRNDGSVSDFLNTIADDEKREDSFSVLEIMREITRDEPIMWGTSIIGFGHYHYKYESGREGDWFIVGFSPRKQALTLYIMAGYKRYEALMAKLGKYKTGKSCLYIKKLSDIDEKVLRQLITESVDYMRKK